MKYYFDSRIRYSELDENLRLPLHSLINYFQDCSTFQSEDLGIGVEYLKEKGKLWVLTSWQISVWRYPSLGEEIRTGTWACGFHGFTGMRNFVMETKAGEPLAAAYSEWAYMDLAAGRPVRADEDEMERYGIEDPMEMEYAGRKIPVPEEQRFLEPVTVHAHHLDSNHHVNNGQYVAIAAEYLPGEFQVRRLRAEYKRQARLGDVMVPGISWTDGVCVVTLNDEAGRPYVILEFSGQDAQGENTKGDKP